MKQKIDRLLVLSEENNKLLHGVRRSQRWSSIWKILYWLLIIGVSFGAFYFIQPYLAQVTNLYQSTTGASFDTGNLQNLLNQYQQSTTKK